jgi:hypothetical protein
LSFQSQCGWNKLCPWTITITIFLFSNSFHLYSFRQFMFTFPQIWCNFKFKHLSSRSSFAPMGMITDRNIQLFNRLLYCCASDGCTWIGILSRFEIIYFTRSKVTQRVFVNDDKKAWHMNHLVSSIRLVTGTKLDSDWSRQTLDRSCEVPKKADTSNKHDNTVAGTDIPLLVAITVGMANCSCDNVFINCYLLFLP